MQQVGSMTNQELKEALLQRCPVVCRGITYDRVSGIIYRAANGQIVVTAELMDKNGSSVTIAESRNISKE